MEDPSFTTKKVPEKIIVGISRRTSNARGFEDISACWQDFFAQNGAARITNRTVPPVMYAVYSDYETDWRGEYSYLIGCGVDRAGAIPEGMEVRRVPAQTYAVFRAKGRMPDEILAVWATVWASDLSRTYTCDLEVYDKRFTRPVNKEVEIYVAVDPERKEKVPYVTVS